MSAFFTPKNVPEVDNVFMPLIGVLSGLLSENQLDNVVKAFDHAYPPPQNKPSGSNASSPLFNNLKSALPYAKYADKEKYYLYFDVPGVSKEDIKLSMSEERETMYLKLTYDRKLPSTGTVQHNELYSGEQTRVLQLPKDVDPSKTPLTKYENGVLSVTLCRSQPKGSTFKNIPIF